MIIARASWPVPFSVWWWTISCLYLSPLNAAHTRCGWGSSFAHGFSSSSCSQTMGITPAHTWLLDFPLEMESSSWVRVYRPGPVSHLISRLDLPPLYEWPPWKSPQTQHIQSHTSSQGVPQSGSPLFPLFLFIWVSVFSPKFLNFEAFKSLVLKFLSPLLIFI